jgi:hypothetical protein
MGSLGGHLIPGSFFIIFGIFWGFVTCIRFVASSLYSTNINSNATNQNDKNNSRKQKYVYKSSTTMPFICFSSRRLRRAPLESYLKIILALIALLIEAYTGFSFHDIKVPLKTNETITSTTMAAPHSHSHEHHHKSNYYYFNLTFC